MQLETSDFTTLIDCGASSLIAMKEQGHDPSAVDAVVISHLHGDHFGGLPFLVLDGQFSRRTRPLTVLGPQGTAQRLQAAMEILYPGSTQAQRRFRIDVHELDGKGTALTSGNIAVRGYEVDHACGAPPLAVTVELSGVTVGYSGDTAWTHVPSGGWRSATSSTANAAWDTAPVPSADRQRASIGGDFRAVHNRGRLVKVNSRQPGTSGSGSP